MLSVVAGAMTTFEAETKVKQNPTFFLLSSEVVSDVSLYWRRRSDFDDSFRRFKTYFFVKVRLQVRFGIAFLRFVSSPALMKMRWSVLHFQRGMQALKASLTHIEIGRVNEPLPTLETDKLVYWSFASLF